MTRPRSRLRRRHIPFLTTVGIALAAASGFAWLSLAPGIGAAVSEPPPHPLELQGAEVRRGAATVFDGDTLVLGGRGVRLFGIDAPAYERRCEMSGADMALGHLSYHELDMRTMGREVTCYIVEQRPAMGSDVGVCEAGATELNQWMVRSGWARAAGADLYVRDEGRARGLGAGLWACDEPIEPWATGRPDPAADRAGS